MSLSMLWPVLIGYGLLMFLISPTARRFGEFFASRGPTGREVGLTLLVSSVVISWIFAKSITNASNLGASYGLVGAVSYAGWYLSIPVAGIVIYALRRRLNATSLAGFLTSKYGHTAAMGFLLVIVIRLINEVWSNTAVVGAYFGASGTPVYFTAAIVFALLTLFYSLRGGLRSSIITDAIQFGLGLFLLVFVLALVIPRSGAATLMSAGEWTLKGGVDLLLVALLQSFSYPFHDPVLTDRAFITRPRVMLRGYLLAGAIAAAFIVLFGLVGVHARVNGIEVGQDAPLRVAQAFGVGMLSMMTVLMMVSAGSTLDSTLASFSRVVVVDVSGREEDGSTGRALLRRLGDMFSGANPIRAGRVAMVFAVIVGSLPLFAGAAIIKATTVSGTMVIGLAPAFLLFAWHRARTFAFHLGFWPGVTVGVLYATGQVPEAWQLGGGPYAVLLGANLWGTLFTFGGFTLGAWLDGLTARRRLAATAVGVILVLMFGLPSLARAMDNALTFAEPIAGDSLSSRQDGDENASRGEEEAQAPPIEFRGQTMFRLTFKRSDPDRPSSEVYNLRLIVARSATPFKYLAELRFRQTPLRSFSPSNVWLQQAWGAWTPPLEGMTLTAGLVYNQLGLFWDGSWFGNLPYLNGHKLDPDMNFEVKYENNSSGGRFGIRTWLQVSPVEDGLNGSFVTARKSAIVLLPADLEASPEFRQGPGVRARVVPSLHAGDLSLDVGGSVQYESYDRADTTGHQLIGGGEVGVTWKRIYLFGDFLAEEVRGLTPQKLRRDYYMGGTILTIIQREADYWPRVRIGFSAQRTNYRPEGFFEEFLTARVYAQIHRMVGFTAEYVRWEIESMPEPELDRFEFILHFYY